MAENNTAVTVKAQAPPNTNSAPKSTKPEGANVQVGVDQKGLPVIPTAYKLMGVTSGYSPKAPEDLRLYITGPIGEGKSTFISSIPDNLILDFEDGANAIPRGRAARVHIHNYDHLEQVLKKLEEDGTAGKRPFRRVTIDTSDEWVNLVESQLNKEKSIEDVTDFGSKGHGWALIRNRCWAVIRRLENAGYTWCIVGHLTERNVTDPVSRKEITVIRPLVFSSLSKQMARNCDMYGNVYAMTQETQQMKTIKLPDGREQKVPMPGLTTSKSTYYLKITSKVRGIPLINEKIELQASGGWDTFKKLYTLSVEDTRKKLSL